MIFIDTKDNRIIPEIEADCFVPVYSKLAKEIGVEATEILFDKFSGQQLCLPKKLYNPSYIYKVIEANYNGSNMLELSNWLGYTQRRLWQIKRKFEQQENAE